MSTTSDRAGAGPGDRPVLVADGVTKRFGRFTAVDGASLTVAKGEVVGLLGANGAGKTTVVRLLLGLLLPDGGAVELFGQPPSRATRARLGYVPQGLGLYDDLTVRENVAFVAAAFGRRPPPALGLGDPDLPIGLAPLGVQRRTAFTAALSHAPELLVLDEPTSGVEPLARARLWETVREAAESGVAVLVTTHHMDEAEQCDRLVVMTGGRVRASGTVEEIVGDERVVEVRAERWEAAFAALDAGGLVLTLAGRALRLPAADADRARGLLAQHGVPAELITRPATLEEAFVRLATL